MFSKLLKRHACNEAQIDHANALPELNSIYYTSDNEFRIVITTVPGYLIINSIISGIKIWLAKEGIKMDSIQVESSELTLNQAAPAMTKFNAEVSVESLQTDVYLFTAELVDIAGNRCNFYLITIHIG